MPHSKRKYSFLILSVLILLVGFGLRIQSLYTMPGGLHYDESNYMYRAWRFARGYGMPLYFYDSPEPFDAVIRGIWLHFAGITAFASEVFSIFLAMICLAATAAAARFLFRTHRFRNDIALVAMLTMAVLPAYVIITRSIYRASWVAPMPMLATAWILYALRSGKRWHFGMAGVFTALAAVFYLAGLVFPVAVALLVLLHIFVYRQKLPHRTNIAAYCAGFSLSMLPWLFLYLTIPDWLSIRTNMLPGPATPAEFLAAVGKYLNSIVATTDASFRIIQYTLTTMGYLNLVLAVLALAGFIVVILRWFKPYYLLLPILIFLFALPAILSGEPDHALRVIGTYAPLALLVGLGAGTLRLLIFYAAPRVPASVPLILALLIGCGYQTYTEIRWHFTQSPFASPDMPHSGVVALYHLGFKAFNQYLMQGSTPYYVPVHVVAHPNATILMRPDYYTTVRSYEAGESLPDGQIVFPLRGGYDFPPIGTVHQYALLLPDKGEIVLLPALPDDVSVALQETVESTGAPLYTPGEGSWQIGHTLDIQAEKVFAELQKPVIPVDAIFDETLELVAMDMPREVSIDKPIVMTLFWRLKQPTSQDYFHVVQAIDYENNSQGSSDGWIYNWLYPTPMWQVGQLIPQVIELGLFQDSPQGAYRLSIGVYVKPRDTFVNVKDYTGTVQGNQRLTTGRFVLPLPPFPEPSDTAREARVQVGDVLRLTHMEFDPLPDEVQPGGTLTVKLFWKVLNTPPGDYTLFVHLMDAVGTLITQSDTQPLEGRYPTGHWTPGETVVTTSVLTLPAELPDTLTLFAGWYSPLALVRLPVVQGDVPVEDGRISLGMWTR